MHRTRPSRRSSLVGLLLLSLAACSDPATQDQLAKVRAELDDTAQQLGELGRELGDLAALTAERLGSALSKEVSTLDERMVAMRAGLDGLAQDARQRADLALAAVETRRAALAVKLTELEAQSGAAAEELRAGVVAAYEQLAAAVEEARVAFSATSAAPAVAPAGPAAPAPAPPATPTDGGR